MHSHGELVRALIGRVALVELAPPVLARALEPFRNPVRTLDASHLSTIEFLRLHKQTVQLASFDKNSESGRVSWHSDLENLNDQNRDPLRSA